METLDIPYLSSFVTLYSYYLLIKFLASSLEFLYIQFKPETNFFKKYSTGTAESWVVVTGGSEGIGNAIAQDFAKQGFNIVLIARTESKLKEVAAKIAKDHGVKTDYLAIDFSKIPQTYEFYEKTFGDLFTDKNVVVLVNNIGTILPSLFIDFPVSEVFKNINMNCFPQTYLTHLFLKKASNKKAIISLSSFSADFILPLHNVYGATKHFCDFLSKGVALENPTMDILSVKPSYVSTALTKLEANGVLIITANKCSSGILKALGYTRETNGYWTHILVSKMVKLIPSPVATIIGVIVLKRSAEKRKLQKIN